MCPTQVVKWQNVCVNMPLAVKEMVMARSLGQIDAATFRKMLQTACSKLCALPVCVVTWLLSYRDDVDHILIGPKLSLTD